MCNPKGAVYEAETPEEKAKLLLLKSGWDSFF